MPGFKNRLNFGLIPLRNTRLGLCRVSCKAWEEKERQADNKKKVQSIRAKRGLFCALCTHKGHNNSFSFRFGALSQITSVSHTKGLFFVDCVLLLFSLHLF